MTAMDAHIENKPLPAPDHSAPPPPPPPGCMGALQLPHWRSEPLPPHLAPTKEEIEKEQYANLPDKLLNTLNKDKKPFTYTPQGVSGVDRGKLDLSNIRSPKMKKRLMANLADDEELDSSRVTRSETPDLSSKPKIETKMRRAITPDVVSLSKQTNYIPVLPKEPFAPEQRHASNVRHSPQPKQETLFNSIPQEEFESFLNQQMQDMEESVTNPEQQVNGVKPSQRVETERIERNVPISHEDSIQSRNGFSGNQNPKHVERVANRLVDSVVNDYFRDENKQTEEQINPNNGTNYSRISDRSDRNENKNKSNLWDSDLLKHVLDGGLQEEIEKFEQISLETEDSLNQNRIRNAQNENYYERTPTWAPPNYIQNPYIQPQSPFGSLNRKQQNKSPQPWSTGQYWSDSPSPSPQLSYQQNSQMPDPYNRGHIPSKPFQTKSGSIDKEVPNYNTRPKPFYLCSPPPTPSATPPPQFAPQQKSTIFGSKCPPKKVDYLKEFSDSAIDPTPQRKFIESAQMYSQTLYNDNEWNDPVVRPSDQYRSIGVRSPSPYTPSGVRSPEPYMSSGFRSPDPTSRVKSPESHSPTGPQTKKKLPPSEQPPDRTPSKYMGANIPSRSFRVLQLLTGEDIANQYCVEDQNEIKRSISPRNSNNKSYFNNKVITSNDYSNANQFGTDF